jgi:hypothetical protein
MAEVKRSMHVEKKTEDKDDEDEEEKYFFCSLLLPGSPVTLQLCEIRQMPDDIPLHHLALDKSMQHLLSVYIGLSRPQDFYGSLQPLDFGTKTLSLPLRGDVFASDHIEVGIAHCRDELWGEHLQAGSHFRRGESAQ